MSNKNSGPITEVINKAYQGDQQAMNHLMPLVFKELKCIANQQRHSFRAQEKTLNTTALVNEAWLKIERSPANEFKDKKHFYAIAAIAMKQILLDEAKKKNSAKRQAKMKVTGLDMDGIESHNSAPSESQWLLQLDHILSRLENLSPRLAELFQLKFFCDLTFDELAQCLGVSNKTAQRDWHKVKTIIAQAMSADTK